MTGLFKDAQGVIIWRNIVGAILLIAGVAIYIIISFTNIDNWFKLVPGGVCIAMSLIAFDFITIKAIKETFEIAKGVKKNQQANEQPSKGSEQNQ